MKPTPPDDLWEKMDALHETMDIPGRDEEGFTAVDYATKYGIPLETAKGRLHRMAQSGKLLQGWKRGANGYRTRVYRFP